MRAWPWSSFSLSLSLSLAHAVAADPIELRDGDTLLTETDRNTWLNRARCLCEEPLGIKLDLSSLASTSRAALVIGKSCLTSDKQLSTSCRTLWTEKVGNRTSGPDLDVSAADLAENCSDDATTLTLSLFVDPTDDDVWTSVSAVKLVADMAGPVAPRSSKLAAGENLTKVEFTSGADSDIDTTGVRYQVLCTRTATPSPALARPPDAIFESPWDRCVAAGEDRLLIAANVCSESLGSASGATVTGLENGVSYTFSVVAVDPSGNPSTRTVLGQATPGQEEDFWERYRRSGGQADGTGCVAAPGGPVEAAVLALGLLNRRRRRSNSC